MDRTKAFIAIAQSQCQASGRRPASRLQPPEKTAFGSAASRLGRALHKMESRIERMGMLARTGDLFDDPAAEIAESANVVRHEMGSIGAHLEALCSTPRQGRHARDLRRRTKVARPAGARQAGSFVS